MTGIGKTPLLILVVGTPFAFAEQGAEDKPFTIDSVHSSVVFRIKHLDVSFAYGRFNDISGSFRFDDDDPSKGKIEVVVAAESIDTNNQKRDDHLRSPDFFDVAKYPDISFRSTKIESVAPDRLNVVGDLTLHGVTRPVTVELQRTGSGENPQGGHRSGFETTFSIKRTDFGMDGSLKGLADEVRLMVSIEGVRK